MHDSLNHLLSSVRCLLWEATVYEFFDLNGERQLCWETRFPHEEAIHQWLPIACPPGSEFACAYHHAVLADDRAQMDHCAQSALLEGREHYQQDYRIGLTTGRFIWIHEEVTIQAKGQGHWRVIGIGTDITEKKMAEEAHTRALENAHCLLWYAWIRRKPVEDESEATIAQCQQTKTAGTYFAWDMHLLNERAAHRWLPVCRSPGENYASSLYMATLLEDRLAGDALSSAALEEGWSTYAQNRRVQPLSGEIRWIREEVSLLPTGTDQWYAAGVMVDVSEQKKAEEVLSHQARHDSLTGLFNRSHFINLVSAPNLPASTLFFLDLDNFKPINDRFGHLVGDQVLAAVAECLRQESGPGGVVSRIGGDEFTIFLPELSDEASAVMHAERLLRSLSNPFDVERQRFSLSASLGIAQGEQENALELLGKANTAMLHAKRKGKGSYAFFTSDMEEANLQRFEREIQLRRAIQSELVTPYYQPIHALKSGQLVGVEALARWPLSGDKFCPPSEFIPIAEETGLIIPLSKLLFRRICLEGRRWRSRLPDLPLQINFNVSERLFREPGSFLQLRQLLLETRFPASSLTLELTESLLLEDGENTRLCLQALHELGVKLVLDDFGTGYSSLAYLTHLPVSAVKIDQSFVRGLSSSNKQVVHQNQAIIRAIVALGKALGLTLTAEGIETQKQLTYLRTLGVDYGQGYLFAPAMPAEAFESYASQKFPLSA